MTSADSNPEQGSALLHDGEDHVFRLLFDAAPVAILVHDIASGEVLDANHQAFVHYGVPDLETLRKTDIWVGGDYGEAVAMAHIAQAERDGPQRFEWLSRRTNGELVWEDVYLQVLPIRGRQVAVATCGDITERKHLEAREERHNRTLRDIVHGVGLPRILDDIVLGVEAEDPEARCSILLLDAERQHLRLGAAPNLPAFYNEAVDGLEIGDRIGSCGTAAWRGLRVAVEDIQTHPYWQQFRELAARAGLRACWSEPVLSSNGTVLATFAIYHPTPRRPTASDISRLEAAADLASLAIERDQTERAAQRRGELEEIVRAISTEFLSLPPDELDRGINHALARIGTFTQADRCYLFLLSRDGTRMHNSHEWCAPGIPSQMEELQNLQTTDFPWWMEHVRRYESVSMDKNRLGALTEQERSMFENGGIRSLLAVPMLHGDRLQGFLGFDGVRAHRHWPEQDKRLYQVAAGIFSAALVRHKLEKRLQHEASHDPLTGIYNRRWFTRLLKNEIDRARRYDTPFSLILFDIDHFKRVNDEYGHDVGDRVLCQLVGEIGQHVRATDILARWGGEEFCLLLPQTDRTNAAEMAELLRRRIARYRFDEVGHITISLGVAQFMPDENLNTLFKRTDEALYAAKEGGRDRVVAR